MISAIECKPQIEFDVYAETFMIKKEADAIIHSLCTEIDHARVYVPFENANEQAINANEFIKERVNLHAYLLNLAASQTIHRSAFDIVIKFAEDAILKQTRVRPNIEVMVYLKQFSPDEFRSSDSVYLKRKLTQLCAKYEVFVTEDWDLFIKELKGRLNKKVSIKRISDLTTIKANEQYEKISTSSNETLNELHSKDITEDELIKGKNEPYYSKIGDPKYTNVNMRKIMKKKK